MAKNDSKDVLLAQLKNPFEPRLVKWTNKGGKSPTMLGYVDARDIMKRLDDVLGAENYQTKYIPVQGGFICELSLYLKGDDGTYSWITRSDGADNTKIAPIKGGISDALKRAGNAWGIGRYLYYMPKWCNRDNVSDWPKWALPNNSIEDWEDVAEMEVDVEVGMDDPEDLIATGIDKATELQAIDNIKDLKKFDKGLDDTTRRLLADQIANKADELTRANG